MITAKEARAIGNTNRMKVIAEAIKNEANIGGVELHHVFLERCEVYFLRDDLGYTVKRDGTYRDDLYKISW